MKQFLAFLIVTAAWAAICRALLLIDLAHPVAVGAIWLIGFVWFTGYIADGIRNADLLTRRWMQMLAGMAVFAGLVVVVLS